MEMPDWLNFELELDNVWVVSIILALFMSAVVWFMPGLFGLKPYELWVRITVSVALIPISYFICSRYFN
jgi:hypothetical protein